MVTGLKAIRSRAVLLFGLTALLLVSLPVLQGFLQTDDYYGHYNPAPVPPIPGAPVPDDGVNVVFFGFSGCAETCPVQLANLMTLQPLVDADRVRFIYVALDADVQQQAAIHAAMRKRGRLFRGVVPDSVAAAKELALAYGGFASEAGEAAAPWERFDHDGRLYVVTDENLRALTYLKPTLNMQRVADDIARLLRQGA